MTKAVYNLRATPFGGVYSITKFTPSLDVESTYQVSDDRCDCPQFSGRGKACRHMKMLPLFLELARTDTDYFLDFDSKTWHRPLLPEYEIEYHDQQLALRRPAQEQTIGIEEANLVKNPRTPDTYDLEVVPTSVESAPSLRLATEGNPASPGEVRSSASASPSVAPLKRRRVV